MLWLELGRVDGRRRCSQVRRHRISARAARNRASLVSAARTAFAELGADTPFAETARRAGVGTATLYRRFPTREDLLEFVFGDRIEDCAVTVDAYLARAQVAPLGAFSCLHSTPVRVAARRR